MLDTAAALYDFYAGFGYPAYIVNHVEEGTPFPYITYSAIDPEWKENATHYCEVWTRSESAEQAMFICDKIKAALQPSVRLKCDGGYVVLRPGTPFVQMAPTDEPEIIRMYINMQINCYHL